MRPPREPDDIFYIIGFPDYDKEEVYKIGITKDLKSRLDGIKCGSPIKPRAVATFNLNRVDALALEKKVKSTFYNESINGEVLRVNIFDLINVVLYHLGYKNGKRVLVHPMSENFAPETSAFTRNKNMFHQLTNWSEARGKLIAVDQDGAVFERRELFGVRILPGILDELTPMVGCDIALLYHDGEYSIRQIIRGDQPK